MPGPYPLATIACTIDANGISSPSLEDIIQSGIARAKQIFGSDIYLPTDSQDYQDIVARAQAQYDTNMANIAAYNNMSPQTAVGVGLSNDVKINGIGRESASNSTVILTLVGVAGTPINNGIAQDEDGNLWDLPPLVIIDPDTGTIDVTATCETEGNIAALPNTVTKIFTQVLGWQTVTNANAATQGSPVELDGALRIRQAESVSLPSRTSLQSIQANIKNLAGVTACLVYQNDTNAPDGNGIPAHSLCAVVAGGDSAAIAQVIETCKDTGCGTFGNISQTVTDPEGLPITIKYQQLTTVDCFFAVEVQPRAGWVASTIDALTAALVAMVKALPIGTDVYQAWAFAAASLPGPLQDTFYITSLFLGTVANPVTITPIPVSFSEQATCATANVAVTVL